MMGNGSIRERCGHWSHVTVALRAWSRNMSFAKDAKSGAWLSPVFPRLLAQTISRTALTSEGEEKEKYLG